MAGDRRLEASSWPMLRLRLSMAVMAMGLACGARIDGNVAGKRVSAKLLWGRRVSYR